MSINFNVSNGIATITINRPEAKNSIDGATAEQIENAVKTINEDGDIRVGIITGAEGTFCAGMDLGAFLRKEVVRRPGTGFAGFTQAQLKKPMIAAVEGYALAGGFEIALACDLVVAAETAKFGVPEAKRGLVANAGGLVRLPRQIPIKIAMELVLTGDMYPAERLAQYGLINKIVLQGGALAAAEELARKIAANGPLAVAISKQVMMEAQDWLSTEMFDKQNAITKVVFESEDAREGALAFKEKRPPVWKGR